MLPQKRSSWYLRFDRVCRDLAAYPERDIYTGAGLAAPGTRIPAENRVKAHEVAGILGLWADIDVAHAVHKKRDRLPPDLEAAQDALSTFEHQPTILVNSGHGLQAWWLFAEPWTIQDDRERTRANALTIW
jgi:hypothetical protein